MNAVEAIDATEAVITVEAIDAAEATMKYPRR